MTFLPRTLGLWIVTLAADDVASLGPANAQVDPRQTKTRDGRPENPKPI